MLDSARGSQIYNWAEREETTEDLSSVSVKSYLRQTDDPYYNRRFVGRLAAVTLDDVKAVAEKYLPLFLKADETQTAVVCGTDKVEHMTYVLGHLGFEMTEIKDLENSILTE